MLLLGAQAPATLCLCRKPISRWCPSRIVATMADTFALLRAERGGLKRAPNFIFGPLRTGGV